MNRRDLFKGLGALVGGVLLDKAIPFNRVWSLPSKLVIPRFVHLNYALGVRVGIEMLEDIESDAFNTNLVKDLIRRRRYTAQLMWNNIMNLGFSS